MKFAWLFVLLISGLSSAPVLAGPVMLTQTTSTHLVNLTEHPDAGSHVAGQTFRTPDATNTILTAFSFEFGVRREQLDYEAFVYEFNTSTDSATGPTLVGSALYSSGRRDTGPTGTAAPPSFSGFRIQLDPAKQYVAFLSTLGLNDGANVYGVLKSTNSNPYADGVAFTPYTNNSLDELLAFKNKASGVTSDLVFSFTFEEPSAVAPVPDSGPGLLALVTMALAAGRARFRLQNRRR